MALKTFRPLTPTSRFKVLPAFDEITKKKPEKSLVETKKKSGGRNNQGRLTTRHIGGGHKQKYRIIDFKRKRRGVFGEVIAIESYKEGEPDVGAQLKRMKAEDLKRYGLSVPVEQTKLTGKLTKLDKKVFYTPGFDAIFIPGRAADAGIITAQLNFHDMKVPFLGANGWNSPDFARTDDSSIDGAVFVDGFFVDSPTPAVQDFVARYKKRFDTNPTLFSMQGYDAAKLVLDAVRKGAASGEAVHDQLLTQPDLSSLAGPAAFGPDGILHRPLFLIQIKRGRFIQVN